MSNMGCGEAGDQAGSPPPPPPLPGSLQGTVLFTAICVFAVVGVLAATGGRLPALPAFGFLVIYLSYAVYEVLAAQGLIPPLCVGGVCI